MHISRHHLDFTPYIKSDIKAPEEDPDSSQALWEAKDPVDVENTYSPQDILNLIDNTSDVIEIVDHLVTFPWMKKVVKVGSTTHLTLPEALIYYELFHTESSIDHVAASLSVKESSQTRLSLTLSIHLDAFLVTYFLEYDYRSLDVIILKNNVNVGVVKYVIRNQLLEEIQGQLNQQAFILDPVWKSSDKRLREEYVTFHNQKLMIGNSNNQKQAIFWKKNQHTSFKSTQQEIDNKDSQRCLMTKSVQFCGFSGHITLCFLSGVLIPVHGQWQLKGAGK